MTNEGLLLTRHSGIAGEQRLYRWGDWGLSVVNGPMLHAYSFAREAAVLYFTDKRGLNDFELCYSTPLTSDVEIFHSDEDADAFVIRAREYFNDPANASALKSSSINLGGGSWAKDVQL